MNNTPLHSIVDDASSAPACAVALPKLLERRWNEKLQQLAELEEAYQKAHQVQRLELNSVQRQQILQLANDIPTLWHANSTTNQERKEILGLLVKQVELPPN